MPHRPLLRWLRRWLRISIRGMIVLVLIIGAGLGWIAQNARIQREAVAAIRRDDGIVQYDWERDWVRDGQLKWDGYSWQSAGKPGALKRIVDRLGVDYVGHPVSVFLRRPGSSSALRNIGRLSQIEELHVYGPFVTDAGLSHLKGLTHLSSLDIGDRVYDPDGTITLRDAARVTDSGMPYLKDLTNLSSLDLNGTQVGDAGLVNLVGMTKLEDLHLADTRVTDLGLVHLKGMTCLKGLNLSETPVTDAGLAHLKALTNLHFLCFRGTRITDAGLAHLEGLAELRMIDLSDTRITDAGLMHLKGLSKLWNLDLRGTQVSYAGVRELELASQRAISDLRLEPQDGEPGPSLEDRE